MQLITLSPWELLLGAQGKRSNRWCFLMLTACLALC